MAIKKTKRIKRYKKSDFIRVTGLPNKKIDVFALIKYCKNNFIPLVNIPEEIASKFRKNNQKWHIDYSVLPFIQQEN